MPRKGGLAGILLVLLLTAAYAGGRHNGFVAYDDPGYVTENPQVLQGLTADGIGWAFTSAEYQYNWHPLTWLSHMLDVQLFGLDAGLHHFASLLLHAGAALLVLAAFRRMTKTLWPSFFVAALFALHPLRVESVAWVSERKDVLSGLFFGLTLWLYARHVEKPTVRGLGAVALALGLGLLSKPILVTTPFVLLLLDAWPLRRPRGFGGDASWGVLVREKLPLFVLCAASCAITLYAQRAGGALGTFQEISLPERAGNAVVACVAYVVKTILPFQLAVFYPHPAAVDPAGVRPSMVLAAAVPLVLASVFAWRQRTTRPYLLVGWLWFLGTLAPVIGLVQVGAQALADRYTYLPSIGLFLAGVFAVAERARTRGSERMVAAAGALLLIGCVLRTADQVRVWRDTETLFTHALEVTERNFVAHENLGRALAEEGRMDEAREELQRAVAIAPWFVEAWLNLALVDYREERFAVAVESFERAVALWPENAESHYKLGAALIQTGDSAGAEAAWREALRLQPGYAEAQQALDTLNAMRESGG